MSVLSIFFNSNELGCMRTLFSLRGPVLTLPQRGRQPELNDGFLLRNLRLKHYKIFLSQVETNGGIQKIRLKKLRTYAKRLGATNVHKSTKDEVIRFLIEYNPLMDNIQ